MVRRLAIAAAVAVAFGPGAPSARAATIVQTASVATQLTELVNSLTVPPFNPFNADLGTLTAVTLTVSANLASTGTVPNNSSGAITVTIGVDSTLTVSKGPGLPPNPSLSLVVSEAYTDLASGGTGIYDQSTTAGPTDFNLTPLAAFIGGNRFQYTVNTDTHYIFAGGDNNIGAQLTTTVGADFKLTYTYTPANQGMPEPATLTGAVVGLASLGMVKLRRRKGVVA
jgi:hypothetical protein